MNSANKVGEIFTAAGQAFSRLGDLTMQLHSNSNSDPSGKWTEEEITQLHTSIIRFSDDLNKISQSIKNRTVSQIRQALKKKAFEDAGIPAKQVPVQQVQQVIQTVQQNQQQQQQIVPQLHHKRTHRQNNANTIIIQNPTQQQQQQQLQSPIHIQHVQHLIPLQQQQPSSQTHLIPHMTTLQSTPKQIIIQQGNMQQTHPQVVHLQPQQIQQIIQQPQATVTLQQFQQMQQQKILLASAAPSTIVHPNATIVSNTPNLTLAECSSGSVSTTSSTNNNNNIIMQHQTQLLPQLPVVTPQQPPSSSSQQAAATAAVITSIPATAAVVPTASSTETPSPGIDAAATIPIASTSKAAASVAMKTVGPDVTMTLNRINTQEHEVDVEECLPTEVVSFDGEEVAG